MADRVAGVGLAPERLPFASGQQVLTACEWSVDIVSLNHLGGGFRGNFFYPKHWTHGWFTTQVFNGYRDWGTPGDYCVSPSHWITSELTPGAGLYWSAQFEYSSGGGEQDGVVLLADPNAAPRFAHLFEGIDGNPITSSNVYNRTPVTFPQTTRWRFERVALVTNPAGVKRNNVGAWIVPAGNYWIWKASNEIYGVWRDVANFYVPEHDGVSLDPDFPIHPLGEWQWTAATDTLDGGSGAPGSGLSRVDVRYYGMRVYSSATKRWYELTDWRGYWDHATYPGYNPWSGAELAANPHGYHAGVAPGKIAMRTLTGLRGLTGAQGTHTGQWIMCGLTYERESNAALPFSTLLESVVSGSATYVGTTFKGPGGYPFVQQEVNRGFYLMHPSTTERAMCVFTASVAGDYYLSGDFARAAVTVSAQGDGVTVSVLLPSGAVAFSQDIPSSALSPDPNDPFTAAGAHKPFSLGPITLKAGDKVRFAVASKGTASVDLTAFRFDVPSFTKTAPIAMPFTPNVASEITQEPTWSTQRLGGGYELRIGKGTADLRRHYTLEFKKRLPADALAIEDYLRQRGKENFTILDPDSGSAVVVVIEGRVRRRKDGRFRAVLCSVVEVFEA